MYLSPVTSWDLRLFMSWSSLLPSIADIVAPLPYSRAVGYPRYTSSTPSARMWSALVTFFTHHPITRDTYIQFIPAYILFFTYNLVVFMPCFPFLHTL